jgi:F-type H+-transporting ATPase subunit delta
MLNPRLAIRYAKSILDLAVERNSLDAVLKDMQLLNSICSQSQDFVVMLRSPVINGDKKISVISEVLKGKNISELTYAFIKLLVTKGRESVLPEIAGAFITQYNELKNIRIVKLTTAVPMPDSIKNSIQTKVSGFMPKDTVDLKTSVNGDLIGGFVLEVEDKLFDASVRKSLNDIRSKIIDTSYVVKLR